MKNVTLLWLLTVSMWAAERPIRTLQLEQFGYQRISCGVVWQGEDGYAKRQIEFLDDEHLLLHYATSEFCQGSPPQYPKQGLHSAIVDVSGRLLHTYDWHPGDDVVAGPDGHILIVSPDAVSVADLNLHTLQTIPWHQEGSPNVPLYRVQVAPSRHGFAIIDRYRAALYTSSPYQETASTIDYVASVGDRGFVTLSGSNPGPTLLDVDGARWRLPSKPGIATFADTGGGQVLGLDRKFNLYHIDQHGNESLIVRLGLLAPGMWNSGFRFDVALPEANRMLFQSHGVRIAFTDTSGLWYYFRTAVVDLKTNKIVFQHDGHIGDDTALSPKGHLFAFRDKARLTLYSVP